MSINDPNPNKYDCPVPIYGTPGILYSNYCVECDERASYVFKGNSLCQSCFKRQALTSRMKSE